MKRFTRSNRKWHEPMQKLMTWQQTGKTSQKKQISVLQLWCQDYRQVDGRPYPRRPDFSSAHLPCAQLMRAQPEPRTGCGANRTTYTSTSCYCRSMG